MKEKKNQKETAFPKTFMYCRKKTGVGGRSPLRMFSSLMDFSLRGKCIGKCVVRCKYTSLHKDVKRGQKQRPLYGVHGDHPQKGPPWQMHGCRHLDILTKLERRGSAISFCAGSSTLCSWLWPAALLDERFLLVLSEDKEGEQGEKWPSQVKSCSQSLPGINEASGSPLWLALLWDCKSVLKQRYLSVWPGMSTPSPSTPRPHLE